MKKIKKGTKKQKTFHVHGLEEYNGNVHIIQISLQTQENTNTNTNNIYHSI